MRISFRIKEYFSSNDPCQKRYGARTFVFCLLGLWGRPKKELPEEAALSQSHPMDTALTKAESAYEQLHQQTLKLAADKGEDHGKRNVPKVDDNFLSPYERELISIYQGQVFDQYSHGCQLLDDLHDKNYKPYLAELERLENDPEIISRFLIDAQDERDRKLEEEELNHKERISELENESGWDFVRREYNNAKRHYEELAQEIGRREPHIHFKPWVYWPLIFVIAACEFPLNKQVFDTFRESHLMTIIMAGVLVLTLPLLSHASGMFLRQGHEKKIYYLLLGISASLMVGITYFTSVLRTNFLALKGESLEQLETDFWTFIVIGLILYFVGLVSSYFAHDDSARFMEVYKSYKRARRKYLKKKPSVGRLLKRERACYNDLKESIQEQYSEKKAQADGWLASVKDDLNEAIGRHDQVLNFYRGLGKRINQGGKESLNRYREMNLTYRKNHDQPNYWPELIPNLELPFDEYKELSPNPRNEKP